MSNQHKSQVDVKAAYTKPTLIEYGSLAERTKIFGFQNPGDSTNPDVGASIGTISL